MLIAAVPQLEALADVSGEQVVQIASQDMTDAIWLTLARRINALLESPDVDAIVVTHGTDTMEETAYFLHLTVDSDKPVVLTGAMRPSTALGADGPNNLYNAVAVASDSSSRGRGVLVVFNDTIHSARDVTKSNTTRVQTFVSPNRGPLGEVRFGEVRYFRAPASTHTASSDFRGISVSSLPEVMIVYAHANMDGRLIDAAVGGGARGLVVAGTGNGNASKIALKAMARAARAGTVVVRSARVGSGFVARNIEVDDDALGFVAAGDLNPQKARVLLALALAEPRSVEQIQKMFFEY